VTRSRPTSLPARLIFAALLLVGVAIGFQSISMGLGQAAVRAGNGPAAASIRPQNGWGLALLAERQLQHGGAAEAIATSRDAIHRTPLAVVAVRTLARAEDKLHGPPAGERAWQAASLLGWRDKQVQVWAAFRALSNRQAEIFAMRADALLRTGDPDELMTGFIRQAVMQPEIRKAFNVRLAINPPWRTRFFQAEMPPKGRALQGVVAVLNDLGTGQTPPTRQELRDAIMGLINVRRYEEAAALDRRHVRRSPDPGSLIDDGGFELRDSDYRLRATPFDWAIDPRGATVEQAEGNHYVVILAAGSPDPALRRFLALSSGAYRVEYKVTGPEDIDRTMRFAVKCAASGATIGGDPQFGPAEDGWQTRTLVFQVPPDCGLTELSVRRTGPSSSVALIDDVVLVRS
jgi:hypothetical protein